MASCRSLQCFRICDTCSVVCGFSATRLLPSYLPIQSLRIQLDGFGMYHLFSFCMQACLLVERLQSVWVSDDPPVSQYISEVCDVTIGDFSILISPGDRCSSLSTPDMPSNDCRETCSTAPGPDCKHAAVLDYAKFIAGSQASFPSVRLHHAVSDGSIVRYSDLFPTSKKMERRVASIPEGLIQKQDPKDALLCRAW